MSIASRFDQIFYRKIRETIKDDYRKACEALAKIPEERLDKLFNEIQRVNPTATLCTIEVFCDEVEIVLDRDFELETFETESCDEQITYPERYGFDYHDVSCDFSGVLCIALYPDENKVEIMLGDALYNYTGKMSDEDDEKRFVRVGKQLFGKYLIEADYCNHISYIVSREFFN